MSRRLRICVKPTVYRRNGRVVRRRGYCYYARDRGRPGRGPELIEISREGALRRLGYSARLPTRERREALEKAVKRYGALTVWRMLNAQYVLRKRVQRKLGEVFRRDRDWVAKRYLKEAG